MSDVHDFTQEDINAIDSFLSIAFYNGYEEDVNDIVECLKESLKNDLTFENSYKSISRPDWQSKYGRSKVDEFGGIFWSWLVLQYGDYGTSPRYGWIYMYNARKILEIIQELQQEDQEY